MGSLVTWPVSWGAQDERPRSRKEAGSTGAGVPRRHGARPRALIIDGHALTLAVEPTCRKFLAELAMECTAVVCCRVSPDQKREVRGVAGGGLFWGEGRGRGERRGRGEVYYDGRGGGAVRCSRTRSAR